MRALTLWQPWASAVFDWKDIENRQTLKPPPELLADPRPYFAIHAGQRYGLLGYAFPKGARVPPESECVKGAIVGVARVLGALDRRGGQHMVSGVVGLDRKDAASYQRVRDLDSAPAWLGPIGWALFDRKAIEPIPCSGALGCWSVPAHIAKLIEARL